MKSQWKTSSITTKTETIQTTIKTITKITTKTETAKTIIKTIAKTETIQTIQAAIKTETAKTIITTEIINQLKFKQEETPNFSAFLLLLIIFILNFSNDCKNNESY